MELIQLPRAMRNRGFTGWPAVYRVSAKEEKPPEGIPYVIAESVDFALLFRLMIPQLMKQHGYFNWEEVYKSHTGQEYYAQRVYSQRTDGTGSGSAYGVSSSEQCDVTLQQLGADNATYVDLDMLAELAMIPTFMTDIREAITINVTNSFAWQDGYDKKRGLCTGSLVEMPRARNLVILDISSSIPDGVSSGMLTLIKTITDIVSADLILTGSQSYFFTQDEAQSMDIKEQRRRIGRNNESEMFFKILRSIDLNYENVITFGDSDHPGSIDLRRRLEIKKWYSFFTMRYDTYGRPAELGAGYGRWVKENSPGVSVIHNTDWAKYFAKSDGERP